MEAGLLAESMMALSGLVQEAAKEDALLASQLPELDGDLSSLTPNNSRQFPLRFVSPKEIYLTGWRI